MMEALEPRILLSADLVVTGVSAPVYCAPGDYLDVSWTVKNVGDQPIDQDAYWWDEVFLSADPVWDGYGSADKFLGGGSTKYGPMAPGGSYTESGSFRLSSTTAVCPYYVIVLTDPYSYADAIGDNNTKAAAFSVGSGDLVVTGIDAPTSITLGEAFEVSWTVNNQGPGEVDGDTAWYDRVYISSDAIWDTGDVSFLGPRTKLPVAEEGSYTSSKTITVTNLPPFEGQYYLIAKIDGSGYLPELDTSNNTLAVPIDINGPDLAIQSWSGIPETISPGLEFDLSFTVKNVGTIPRAAGTNWYDRIYYSSDDIWDPYDDRQLASVTHDGSTDLAVGEQYTVNASVRIPDDGSDAGYLILVTDAAGNYVIELDEANNAVVIPLALATILPDLQITDVSAPLAAAPGDSVEVSWTVENIGEGLAVPSWTDAVYWSADDQFDELDYVITSWTYHSGLPNLATGESYTQTRTISISEGFLGSGWLVFSVDCPFLVPNDLYRLREADETNNILITPLEVAYPPRADLVVSDVVVAREAISGQPLEVTWTVTNVGDVEASAPWTDLVVLSVDDDVSPTGNVLSNGFIYSGEALAPGGSVTRTQVLDIPIEQQGVYYLLVKTDSGKSVVESDYDNNVMSPGTVEVFLCPYPNLQVTEITTPVSALSGQSIEVTWTVTNNGNGSTNALRWYDQVWLSQDENLDTGENEDVLLGSVENPSYLAPGESHVSSLLYTLPEDADGLYYILVRTDQDNRVWEYQYDLDNMAVSASFAVDPAPAVDLQVTSVIAPPIAFSTQPMEVSWRVSNLGVGPTSVSEWADGVYLSSDTQLSDNDLRLALSWHEGVMQAGDYYEVTASFTLPPELEGEYYVLVAADAWVLDERYANDLPGFVYERGAETNNVTVSADTVLIHLLAPDLEGATVETARQAVSGHLVPVTYDIANRGTTRTIEQHWVNSVYLSRDAVWDMTDIELGQDEHWGRLEVGQSQERSISMTLPEDAQGSYYVIVWLDSSNHVSELDDDNNMVVSIETIDVTFAAADLAVSLTGQDMQAELGQTVWVPLHVSNVGETDTVKNSWQETFYLSDDEHLSPDDRQIGAYTRYGVLDAGQSYQAMARLDLPMWMWPAISPGSYYLVVVSDGLEQVFEDGREANNVDAVPLTLTLETPDLVTTNVVANAVAWSGQELNVQWVVQNMGQAETAGIGWNDGVGLVNAANPEDGVFLGIVPSARSLAPGGTYAGQAVFTLPRWLSGEYYVSVMTDSLYGQVGGMGSVIEAPSETNNSALSAGTTTVYASPLPDLIVENISTPADALGGQSLELNWTLRNIGDGDVAETRIWFDAVYLSRDAVFDRDTDMYLGMANVSGPIASEGSISNSGTFKLPAGVSGLFYAFVVTNVPVLNWNTTSYLYESDSSADSNRSLSSPFLVRLADPSDLAAGLLDIPANATPGQSVTLTYSVDNLGPGEAVGRWFDSLYISTDDVWDIDDVLIGRVEHIGSVSAGESYTETFEGVLPAVAPGSYCMIVRSDILNAVPEADDNNNAAASLLAADIDTEILPLGGQVSSSLFTDEFACYKLDVSAGQTVRLGLDVADDSAMFEMYVAFERMPTRGDFDYLHGDPYLADQTVTVPTTLAGTYYVMVRAESASPSANYILSADALAFQVETVGPGNVGNAGTATLEIEGARFGAEATCELIGPGGAVIAASAVYGQDAAKLFATFDLTGKPLGEYDVRVRAADGSTAALEKGLTVVEGQGAKLEVGIAMPSAVLVCPFTIQLEYANTGDADIYIPLLTLTGPDRSKLGLQLNEVLAVGKMQLLGYSSTGPMHILRPGQREQIIVHCGTLEKAYHTFTIEGYTTAGLGDEPVGWDELGWRFMPPYAESSDAWAANWRVFRAVAGDSWSDVLTGMIDMMLESPLIGGRPNIIVDDLMSDLFARSLGGGGGLTDTTPPSVIDYDVIVDESGALSVDLIFSETIAPEDLPLDQLTLTAPNAQTSVPVALTRIVERLYRVSFGAQTAIGEYRLLLGTNTRDRVGLPLDQDGDGVGGQSTDGCAMTFSVSPDGSLQKGAISAALVEPADQQLTSIETPVPVSGGDDPASWGTASAVAGSDDKPVIPITMEDPPTPMTDNPSITFTRDALLNDSRVSQVTISGTIHYTVDPSWPELSERASQVRIELWEQDGLRDTTPGEQTTDGDGLDDLVALLNDETGTIYASVDGTFTFDLDVQGLPLLNLDYDDVDATISDAPALADYYLVIWAENPFAFEVASQRLQRPSSSRQWVSLYPDGEPTGLTEEGARWAYLYTAEVSASPTFSCEASTTGEVQNIRDDGITISAADMPKFTPIEAIRVAGTWFQQNAGFSCRRIAVIHLNHSNPEFAGFETRADLIFLAQDAREQPLSAIHEYGHAIQFALAGYQAFSYGRQTFLDGFVSGPYGIITESTRDGDTFANTAFAEGWAVFITSAVSKGWAYEQNSGVSGSMQRLIYNRSSQFLDNNSFWMGADAYQYGSDANERLINGSSFIALYDGTNDNASKGELVLGGVASIFWDIHSDLNALGQLRFAMQGAPAQTSSLTGLHDALVGWNPSMERAVNTIFIDHGIAVKDDTHNGELGDLSESTPVDGLVMSHSGANECDTFRFTLSQQPYSTPQSYATYISLYFASHYGDLDLVVEKRSSNGSVEVFKDVASGGGVARVRLNDLDTGKSYAVKVKVYGHGGSGFGQGVGGDFHPDYRLVISPNLPGILEDDEDDGHSEEPKADDSDSDVVWVTEPWDPNDIIGPEGYGPLNWVQADEAMDYDIRFENYAEATAAARQVVITQQLDDDLDWRTFRVGDFGWGTTYVSVDANRTFYSGRVDARDTLGVYVDVYVALDIHRGVVTWLLTAIDPETGQMTMDPALGLLPPEDGTGIGQGFVSYSILPLSSAATGTVVTASASITFDTQPSIATPEIFHTLDADKPTAEAVTPAEMLGETQFNVSWVASDAPGGSGLQTVDVYVSENGSAWELWLDQVASGQSLFAGVSGYTYAFCAVASDNAGNVESGMFAPEALISVWDASKPAAIESIEVNEGADQRSIVSCLRIVFDQPVVLGNDAVTLIDEFSTDIDLIVANPSADGRTYDVAVYGGFLVGASLPDGWYRITINSDMVVNLESLPMSEDTSFEFFRLFGDIDGDRDVDRGDYIQIRGTLNKSEGQAGFNGAFDYDGNGLVDVLDVGEMKSRLNTWLDDPAFPAPAAPEAPIATVSATEPQIESVLVNNGAAQRSMVTSLTVTFDQAVQVNLAAFVLTRSDGLTVDLNVANPTGDGRTFVLTFDGPSIVGGSLADGNYTLSIRRDLLTDLGGNALNGPDETFSFHRYYGDWDGDKDVDYTDVMGLVRAYGSRSGLRTYDSAFDYDGDGDVDIFDVMPMIYNYRKPLT